MLDLEPWLNETTACTFPEPFFSEPIPEKQLSRITVRNKNQKETDVSMDKSLNFNLKRYEGTFGNFAYGNITVSKVFNSNSFQLLSSLCLLIILQKNYFDFNFLGKIFVGNHGYEYW